MQSHIETEKSKQANQDEMWITLKDSYRIKTILKTIGDKDKKSILKAVFDEPHIISEILEISMVPHTTGYRKINSLIDDEILIPQGHVITHNGKTATKYGTVFSNINVLIEKNKEVVKVLPAQSI